ncbi:MAG: ATP-dependent dethiobiotin synthetase BioD 1 [Stenotrophomonas maltophilia]|uniref:ATP-dependent dethiobiotin synthetase BioD n=1 Tax=Stenotrophomonas maltophilia TaxID=40324 RepID=A0A7V8FEZ5_STEMA|nr:MAG: ATP-dependent dethiobiotin synthetase BioD 1 [Stenotrophomonas maltophilia]
MHLPAALPPALFVTGTDTEIGKTASSTALLHALRRRGLRAVGMKPVASGSHDSPDGLRNEDALALQAASWPVPAYSDLNPYALRQPLAPELAAAEDGVCVELAPIVQAFQRLRAQADVVVVEGVAGWLAPVSATLDQIDLVRALQLPVVLVAGLRLGCVNHARLTAEALQARGVECLGWIGNHIDPAMQRQDENVATLQQRLAMPCWGRLPYLPGADGAVLSAYLREA